MELIIIFACALLVTTITMVHINNMRDLKRTLAEIERLERIQKGELT